MSYWVWDSALDIGIDVIDGQHRRIVDYINDLHEAHTKHDHDQVTQILLGLVDYTVTHFAFEEDLMAQAGYPLSDSHKKVHESFIAHIKNYKKEHEKGRDIARKLMSELQIWLTNHIKNEDRHYVPYANEILDRKKSWLKKALGNFFGSGK